MSSTLKIRFQVQPDQFSDKRIIKEEKGKAFATKTPMGICKTSDNLTNWKACENHNSSLPQAVCHGLGKPLSQKRKKDEGTEFRVNPDLMNRAKEIQSTLPPEFPSVIKTMLPSHVTRCFWLHLPKKFCDLHLPKEDVIVTLVDESGKEDKAKYLWAKSGLSGGWRGFALSHKLLEGDLVIFQLIEPTKFKVYFVRSNGFGEVDGALGLLRLDCPPKGVDAAKDLKPRTVEEDNYWKPLSKVHPIENDQEDNHKICVANTMQVIHKSEDGSDILVAEVLDGIRFSESAVAFEEVRSMEDFQIVINGLVIDSEFSKNIRGKYYDLCCSQQSFLHDQLLEGLNCKLAAGIISEIVSIADAIRSSKITTSIEHFSIWGQTLKAFKDLGMNVGFLCTRLDQLVNLAKELNRNREAKSKRTTLEENVRNLEVKLLEAKEAVTKLDDEIENFEKNGAKLKLELMFQEIANAPW